MNFRTTIVLAALALTICAAGCFTIGHQTSNEPSYQNRRLSEWLRDFDNNNLTWEQKAMAADALRHIGSPAVPFLVERFSEARLKQTKIEQEKWHERQATAVFTVDFPANPRREALAALDALGPAAEGALPALEKLLHEDQPDAQALYVAVRIGPAGMPLLNRFLTSTNIVLRMQAQICLDMMNSHSEVLYPKIPAGPNAPSFDKRICELNLKMMQAAAKKYATNHPDIDLPSNMNQIPPPSLPPR